MRIANILEKRGGFLVKKVNAAFWKSERMLLYFLCISLLLVVLSVISPDRRCVDFLLLYWIKKQEYGILSFSIFLGFLSLWLYSIKEREKDYRILKMLGINQLILYKELQVELLKFQMKATIIPIIVYAAFFVGIGEKISVLVMFKSFFRIHFDLQILLGIIDWIRLKQIKTVAPEPFL